MRLGSNIVGSASNCIQFFEIQASAQLEPGFGFILMIGFFVQFDKSQKPYV